MASSSHYQLTMLLLLATLLILDRVHQVQSFSVINGKVVNGGTTNGVIASKEPTPVATPSVNGENDNDESIQELNISFVTGNQMKARELAMILSEYLATENNKKKSSDADDDDDDSNNLPFAFNVRTINVDLPEIQEVNTEAIAKEKALLAAQLAGGPCVVEDTSLKFHALGGMPGPYIKWFQEKLKSDGLYKILMAYEDKSATASCTLAFCPAPHADPILFTGEIHGRIIKPVPGRGFGWDSIFVPNGSPDDQPFSCMTIEEKNQYSHRGKAVRQWAQWVSKNKDALLERQSGQRAIGHKGLDFKCISPED